MSSYFHWTFFFFFAEHKSMWWVCELQSKYIFLVVLFVKCATITSKVWPRLQCRQMALRQCCLGNKWLLSDFGWNSCCVVSAQLSDHVLCLCVWGGLVVSDRGPSPDGTDIHKTYLYQWGKCVFFLCKLLKRVNFILVKDLIW